MSEDLSAIRWDAPRLHLLDQRGLPHQRSTVVCETWQQCANAIAQMVVRGAPAIAITAAYGMALAVRAGADRSVASAGLLAARPTAVNLRWALERLAGAPDPLVEAEAVEIHAEDIRINRALGAVGGPLLTGGVLTICNTGTLATGGYGTALGMVRHAHARGDGLHVYALETRPYLQGARLTAYECVTEAIPCTLITDGMAAAAMATGRVQSVVVGCDRVAANGDTANKIGTLQLAVLARHYGLPFYVAMPSSTLDRRCATGADIVIETRGPEEVRSVQGKPLAPHTVAVWNPAFDVTPAALVTGWVTEFGVWQPPFPTR
ncbi:MAG TPA: S-methyl-5-thioribose-1-phosphate isomerase [Deltaproteobacteria bacterium]|nr:S-methyl-5-thioribose-1-phosphate isomerase [Deltaproteobacteria bacterium]